MTDAAITPGRESSGREWWARPTSTRRSHYELAGLRELAYHAARASGDEAARLSAHREAFELLRRAVHNIPDDIPELERAELLARYAGEASAIEENAVAEEMAGRPAPRIRQPADRISPPWPWSRSMPSATDGQAAHERRALIHQAEAESAGLAPDPDHDMIARELAFDRLR